MARVEVPAPGDLIMDPAGNIRVGVAVSLKVAGTSTDVTHYSALTAGTSTTGGLVTGSDGTIVDGSGNRRYVRSGVPLDMTIAGRSRRLEPASAAADLGYVVPVGLVGDNSTSDYSRIIDAQTLGASTKRPVWLPAPEGGGYAIDAAIPVSTGDRFAGARWEDTYLKQLTDNTPIFQAAVDNTHSVVIENLRGTWARQQTSAEPRSALIEWAPPASGASGGFYLWKMRNLKVDKAAMAFSIHDSGGTDAIPVWGCRWDDIWAASLGVGYLYLRSGTDIGKPSNVFTQNQIIQRIAALTTLTAGALTGAVTLTVGDTSRMSASGTGIAKTTGQQPIPFSYTGKTPTTLTGCAGIVMDLANGAEVGQAPGTCFEAVTEAYLHGFEVENWAGRIMYVPSGAVELRGLHVEHHMVIAASQRLFEFDNGKFDVSGAGSASVAVERNLPATGAAIVYGGSNARVTVRNIDPVLVNSGGSLSIAAGAPRSLAVEGAGGSPPGTANGSGAGSTRMSLDQTNAQAIWTVDGLPPRLDSTQALPAAGVAYRGRKFIKEYSISGITVNTLVECRLTDGNTYAWHLIDGGYVTLTVTTGAAISLDVLQGKVQRLNLQAAAGTITIANAYQGAEQELRFVQDGTGSRTYALPTGIKLTAAWTASTGVNREDVLGIRYDGAAWRETHRALNVGAVTS